MAKWEFDEIALLTAFVESGWTHKEISDELDRTYSAVKGKACSLKVCSLSKKKTTEQYKAELPPDITVLELYIGAQTKILHKHSCGYIWYSNPDNILSGHGCPLCAGNIKKTTEQYKAELPPDTTVLEEYINNNTKILHKHSCGYIWSVAPSHILRGIKCPKCSKYGFNPELPAVTYCIYFKDFDLYKVGISNNYTERINKLGSIPEVVYIRKFDIGIDAMNLEKLWKENLKDYLVNTGLLRTGNTETFRY